MSLKKLVSLIFYSLDDLVPLLSLSMCFDIWLALNLTPQAGMFEGFFNRVFDDFER